AEDFHDVGAAFGGPDGDPDPPRREVHAGVEDERTVRPQRASYFHDKIVHVRLLPEKVADAEAVGRGTLATGDSGAPLVRLFCTRCAPEAPFFALDLLALASSHQDDKAE